MARIFNRPVKVETDGQGRPEKFYFRGPHVVAEVLDSWKETDDWWAAPLERQMYRVQTADGGIFELEHRRPPGRWYLYKAYD